MTIRILRIPETCRRVGLSKSRLHELEQQGLFPRRVKISARASGHVESEVEEYLAQRVAERDGQSAA